MQCRKCRAELPDNAKYCPQCGAKQDVTRKPKARGSGNIYQAQIEEKERTLWDSSSGKASSWRRA